MIYRLDIIFSATHMAQSMVSKINFFCQRDIRKGIPNFIPCQEVEKWQWLIFSMRHLVEMSGEVAVYAYRNASNLRSQDVSKEILSDLERKDVAER